MDVTKRAVGHICYCRFHRQQKAGDVVYHVLPESVVVDTDMLRMNLHRQSSTDAIAVEVYFISNNIFRIRIKPTETARQRYEIPVGDVLISEPALQR